MLLRNIDFVLYFHLRTKVKYMIWKEFVPKSITCMKEYSWAVFRADLIAGITVGIVALPLAMGFAIAAGVGPERGLYTAIVAGFLVGFLGGTRVQIAGPTGAFVAVIYDIVARRGYEGLVPVAFMASLVLIALGLLRLGRLIRHIPIPIVVGFTSGIALLIFSSQIKGFFGLKMGAVPTGFIQKWQAYFPAFSTWSPLSTCFATATFGFMILIRRFLPVIPWGIAAIVLSTLTCYAFDLPLATIHSVFGELPRSLPMPSMPSLYFEWEMLRDVMAIALLAGIESLLSAVIADRIQGTEHRSNCELVAHGVANFGSILFGGIPATAAIARTATNIKAGARTPMAGMIHAVTLFLIILFCAPVVSHVPLAGLSAVLIMVAWNMSEVDHFAAFLKSSLRDATLLISSFLMTVLFDLTLAVAVGMSLVALFAILERARKRVESA
jgi:SulP family sulfate permease